MENILNAPFMKELMRTAENMYRLGWNERNAGNISMILYREEIEEYLDLNTVKRVIPISVPVPDMAGFYFVITGAGKYFSNVKNDPENCLGIIRIQKDGAAADLLWGLNDGGNPTSETSMHLCAHNIRLKRDPTHRVVTHAHPTNIVTMTHLHDLNEREFSRTLWKTCAESILVFPEGVAVLPWMVNGSDKIGIESAKKFEQFRILVWAMHGVTATGSTLSETVGLLEVVEKSAGIYITCLGHERVNEMTDEMLKENIKAFGLQVKKGWL